MAPGVEVGAGLGHGEDGGRLREAVELHEGPAALLLQPLHVGEGRGRARHGEARFGGDGVFARALEIEDAGQHRRGHAGEGHALVPHQPVKRLRFGRAHDHVFGPHRRERVDAAPAVAVEHGQRPHVHVVVAGAHVDDVVVGVGVEVAVREHHALGPRRRARGVVDADEVVLVQLGVGRGRLRLARDQILPVAPAVGRGGVAVARHDPVLHLGQPLADGVERARQVRIGQQHTGPRMREGVAEVVGDEAVVEGHEHGPDERGSVERFEEVVAVGAEDADAVALAHAQPRQRVGEAAAAGRELGVGEAPPAVHHRLFGP